MNARSLRFRLLAWYALWLTAVLLTTGLLMYFGLRRYLERNLATVQSQRAARIATLVARTQSASEKAITEEISTQFAPEASGRFIRICRLDGRVLHQSGMPHDQSFDPVMIPDLGTSTGRRKEVLMDGTEMILASLVYNRPKEAAFVVHTGEPSTPALLELRRLLSLLALASLAAAVLALGGGFVLVDRALRPVEEITRSAELITSRNLSERLPTPPRGGEFEHLSSALNRMITRLDEAFQHNRRFLADASHELRTPLTIVRGELEGLVQEPRIAPELRERLGSTLEETDRLARIVEGLFGIARLDAGEAQTEWVRFDLARLAAATADQLLLLAEDKQITVRCFAEASVWIEGDRARIKQVVVNLLDNAIKYTQAGGWVELRVQALGRLAVMEVSDNGPGIPAESLPHVFERFYRVDKARSRALGGAGLGLSIVKSICLAHGGRVEALSRVGSGSVFRVELPTTAAPTTGTSLT